MPSYVPVPAGDDQAAALGGGNWAPGPAAPVGARGKRGRRSRAPVWALAAVIVAASAGAVVVLGTGALRGPRHVTARPAPGAVVFEQLLAQSANAQQLEATAVAHACQESAPGAPARNSQLTELNRAVKLEYSVLGAVQVDTRELSTVPEGVLLLADLDAVAAAGLTIGRDYEGWLQDLQATGCYSAPTNDIHYRAAGVEVVAASGAEQRLAGTWDGIAARYNLRAWTAAQI